RVGPVVSKKHLCVLGRYVQSGLSFLTNRQSAWSEWLQAGVPLVVLFVLFVAPSTSNPQSGRQKSPTPSPTPSNGSRPRQTTRGIAQPTPRIPPASGSGDPPVASSGESDDVVGVSSILGPVPASVMDLRGSAVTNLKLEDFELRVDGQPNR